MTTLNKSTQEHLRQFVSQIENLEEQKAAISADLRDKFLEAKAVGFDVKALRQIVRLRKKTRDQRQEEEGILQVYLHALGMLVDTPLGDFAMRVAAKNDEALNEEIAEAMA